MIINESGNAGSFFFIIVYAVDFFIKVCYDYLIKSERMI